MSTPQSDPTNTMHLASLYVEELKYGPGEGKVERVGPEELDEQLETLLRDAGMTDRITPGQLRDAITFYGNSNGESFRVSPLRARSIFLDGVMHGIALAAGLAGEQRDPKGSG